MDLEMDQATNREGLSPNASTWLLWILLGTIGWAISLGAKHLLGMPVSAWEMDVPMGILDGLIVGSIVGVFQFLVLARRRYAVLWIPISALGHGAASAAVHLALLSTGCLSWLWQAFGMSAVSFVVGSVYGAVVGIAQWLLVRKWLRRSGMWLVAWVIGAAVGDSLAGLFVVLPIEGIIVLSGAITEAVLGFTFVSLVSDYERHSSAST
jgi:hypothetical protein